MAVAVKLSAPVDLALEAGNFRLILPEWGEWLYILDRAARGLSSADHADPDQLLRAWLSATATRAEEDGTYKSIPSIVDLPATLADQLMAEGTSALAEQNRELQVTTEPIADGIRVMSRHHDFTLSPLSFSERNRCLRHALVIKGDNAQVQASQYELSLVARSTVDSETNEPVGIPTLRALPIVVGEALITAARELSDPAAETEIAAFEKSGVQHPDVELATLCLTFGMTPDQAENLPAATAKRLNAAARLLASAGSLASVQPATTVPDNVTKIVIHDD